MVERRVVVGSSVGLHARPAALFVQAAGRQPVPVSIGKDGVEPVDARSILMVLGLDAKGGDEVILTNFEHQPAATPYRSRHAIFVRAGETTFDAVDAVPDQLRRRILSLRAFDRAVERQRQLGECRRRHSAATARPICSQVGATSETVARRMSRA